MSRLFDRDGPTIGSAYLSVRGDGNCLYRAIALKLFGDEEQWPVVKRDVINHVSDNWLWFQNQTDFATAEDYRVAMSGERVYGGFVEASAASEHYRRSVVIFENGQQYVNLEWPNDNDPIVLRYSATGEHYDLYEEYPAILGHAAGDRFVLPSETNGIPSEKSNSRRSSGRPKTTKRGRPKISINSISEQKREASKKFKNQNPDVAKKYNKLYKNKNPNTVKEASDRFHINNPDANKEKCKRYREVDLEKTRSREINYKKMRHLPAVLRNSGRIAQYTGDKLNNILPFNLKKPSLFSSETYHCPHCGAKLFEEERGRAKWCCGKGAYNILNLPPLDAEFYDSPDFCKRARMYNELFAFSAISIPQGWQHPRSGLSFIKIQGKMYHKVYDLSYSGPRTNNSALYIDDGEARTAWANRENLNFTVVHAVSRFLHAINPYISLFRQLNEEPSEHAHLVFENTTRRVHGPNLGDRPLGYEVAAVLSTDTEKYYPRKIAIWKVGESKPHTVDVFHPLYEAFQYPLLYPHGTPGWHIGRVDNHGAKLSQLNYIRCLLLSEPRFSMFGRLSETWLVDMFARIEEERLRFLYHSQSIKKPIRTAPLDELNLILQRSGAEVPVRERRQVISDIRQDETVQGEGGVIPGRVYLPSTFTGGPRYMKVKYLNAMALVSRLGGPTYFLTVTTNAQWAEIKKSKRAGSTNQPDVCARVFHCKLLELMRDLRSGAFFGDPSYIIWVIEFQKRGLPHAHICFRIADGEGAPVQAKDVDTYIRADIPSEEEAGGRLRELVLASMIHGPCGPSHRTNLPCWDETQNRCTKNFPKQATQVTYIDTNGFPHYKRDSDNKIFIKFKGRQVEINDTWVVPYNAPLLLKYQCHINLELSSSQRVVKYLFKYITKGSPLTSVAVVNDNDINNEVEQYVTKRYIGSSDAAWRILGFTMTESEPSVICLPVHLENKQAVYFRPGDEAQAAQRSTSQLVIYFTRPQITELDKITYREFYEKYIIHSSRPQSSAASVMEHPDGKHYITKRQRGKCVARMFWVSPKRGEQFFLRLLLNTYPARGYQDLISQGGEGCTSFQQAARALGLVDDEQEYRRALTEASEFMLGKSLRSFFVTLCNTGAPAVLLWEEFKVVLCEDLLKRFPDDAERAYKLALIYIDRCLRRHGSSLADQGLPVVQDNSTELGRELMQYSEGRLQTFVDEWLPKLTDEQIAVFNYVKEISTESLVQKQSGQSYSSTTIFLDGPGGYGKTLLLKLIAADIRSKGKVVLCVASSGLAALNFEGGTTAHSMFLLPLDMGDGSGYWSLSNGTQRAELIRESCLIIFDEAPMASRFLIEMLERSLQDLMGNTLPFGGKAVLFSGDFRQCAPVVTSAKTPSDIISISLRSSRLWDKIKQFKLSKPQRTGGEEMYTNFLLKVGGDELEHTVVGEGREKQSLIALQNIPVVESLAELIGKVYPRDLLTNANTCANRAILCTINANVNEVNALIIEAMEGELHHMYSVDWVDQDEDETDNLVDDDILHQAQGKGVPDHVLPIKVGTVFMVTRNLNFTDQIVNGTKVIIEAISPQLITVRKPGHKERFGIPRIIFKFPLHNVINMCRRQFPLTPCYAMSVHKSQGQTIEFVGVDLRTDVFSHGQLYVALSRVRSPAHIAILVPKERIIDGKAFVKNIVYKELL